jgi:hypothetical protein
MSIPLLSILILAAMFIIATVLPVNMGALAFVGAFVLGVLIMGLTPPRCSPPSPEACS